MVSSQDTAFFVIFAEKAWQTGSFEKISVMVGGV
jgi:hypothetical protein